MHKLILVLKQMVADGKILEFDITQPTKSDQNFGVKIKYSLKENAQKAAIVVKKRTLEEAVKSAIKFVENINERT